MRGRQLPDVFTIALTALLTVVAAPATAANLHALLTKGNLEKARSLIEKGKIDPKKSGSYLIAASALGYADIVKLLIDQGTDARATNSEGESAFLWAAAKGHLEIIEMLSANGGGLPARSYLGWTPLLASSEGGHLEVVEWLLELGVEVDETGAGGWTALMLSTRNGHPELVALLLERGASLDRTNSHQESSLFLAAEQGHEDLVQYLVDKGADIALETDIQWTPLMAVSKAGLTESARVLVEKGASLDQQNGMGETALDLAALGGHERTVRYLIEAGAEARVVTARPETAHAMGFIERTRAQLSEAIGERGRAAQAYDRAAESFKVASESFAESARIAGRRARNKAIKEALLVALLALGEQYQARAQADQFARLAALEKASGAGTGIEGYYSALHSYESSHVFSSNLPVERMRLVETVRPDQLRALKFVYEKLAEDSRISSDECAAAAQRLASPPQ